MPVCSYAVQLQEQILRPCVDLCLFAQLLLTAMHQLFLTLQIFSIYIYNLNTAFAVFETAAFGLPYKSLCSDSPQRIMCDEYIRIKYCRG